MRASWTLHVYQFFFFFWVYLGHNLIEKNCIPLPKYCFSPLLVKLMSYVYWVNFLLVEVKQHNFCKFIIYYSFINHRVENFIHYDE